MDLGLVDDNPDDPTIDVDFDSLNVRRLKKPECDRSADAFSQVDAESGFNQTIEAQLLGAALKDMNDDAWHKSGETKDLFDDPEALAKVMNAEPIEGADAEEEDGDRTPPPGAFPFTYDDNGGSGECGEYSEDLDDAGEEEFEPQGSLGGFGNMTLKGMSFGSLGDDEDEQEGDAVEEPVDSEDTPNLPHANSDDVPAGTTDATSSEEEQEEMVEIDEAGEKPTPFDLEAIAAAESREKDRRAAAAVIAGVTGSIMDKLRAGIIDEDEGEGDIVKISPVEVTNDMYEEEEDEEEPDVLDSQEDKEADEGTSSFMFTTGKLQLKRVNYEKETSPADADSIGADGEGENSMDRDTLKLFEGSHARENFSDAPPHPLAGEDDDEDDVDTTEVKISIDIAKEEESEGSPEIEEVIDLELGDAEDEDKGDGEDAEGDISVDADDAQEEEPEPPKLVPAKKPEHKTSATLPNRYNKSAKVGSGAFRDLLIYAVDSQDQFARKTKGYNQVRELMQKRELINESWSYQARLKKHHQMQPGQPLPPVLQLPRLARPLDPSLQATNANKINDHGPPPACSSTR